MERVVRVGQREGGRLGPSVLAPDRMVLTERFRDLIPLTILLQLGQMLRGMQRVAQVLIQRLRGDFLSASFL